MVENRVSVRVLAWTVVILAAVLVASGCSDGRSSSKTRGVVETFADAQARDQAATTAAWGLDGNPGLFATYGFGGDGSDGALVVAGEVVLDSGAAVPAAPGPDGLVEWNFSSLTVEQGGSLRLTGSYPIRLKVLGPCSILGTLDASGRSGANAPAGQASAVGKIAGGPGGPGGGAGGEANAKPNDPIGSYAMDLRGAAGYPPVIVQCNEFNRSANRIISVIEENCGGGTGGNRGVSALSLLRSGCSGNGGGHAGDGMRTDFRCQNLQYFGIQFGVRWVYVVDLVHPVQAPTAGTGGGAGGNAAITFGSPSARDDVVAGSGGGGGGGLEIECAGSLVVAAGATILADGGHGGVGHSTLASATTVSGGYGGGGAGGSIWLSGTSVVVESGARVSAIGGVGNPAPPIPGDNGNGGPGYTIIRDLAGSPTVVGTVVPAAPGSRSLFDPERNGTSQAVSSWYDGVAAQPDWSFNASDPQTGMVVQGSDLVFAQPPAVGQTVVIDFQAAPDKGGVADPDPATWFPGGNTTQDPYAAWTTDLALISAAGDYRWLRFRVRFDLGPVDPQSLPLNQIVIESIRIRR